MGRGEGNNLSAKGVPFPASLTHKMIPSSSPIIILGGRGMLGTDLAAVLTAAGRSVRVLDLPECDVRNPAHLDAAVAEGGVIVNCAAYTNVDKAESEPELAQQVNALAPAELGRLAKIRDAYVLHISTDFVFDGSLDRPYTETDIPRPLSVYGATKLAGEQLLDASGCRHATVRVQWTYGAAGNHFLNKLAERARAGGVVRVVADQFGAPTWTRDVSTALLAVLDRQTTGLYHFAAAGYASRFEVAQQLAAALKLPARLEPCQTSDFPAPAQRPLNSRFNCAKIDALLPATPRRPWPAAMADYIAQYMVTK